VRDAPASRTAERFKLHSHAERGNDKFKFREVIVAQILRAKNRSLMRMIEMNGISKIEQLKSELNQKTNELNESLNVQYLLRRTLKNNTRALDEVENMLKALADNLKHSNEYIDTLKQENQGLKLSCDVWMKRAIKLEFEVLSAREAAKK